MALALALFAIQGIVVVSLGRWHPVFLVIALCASFGLRDDAARLWEQELLYTYRLYLLLAAGAR
jgi:hypothetical protein